MLERRRNLALLMALAICLPLLAQPAGQAASAQGIPPVADFVLTGGNVITMNAAQPRAEAIACSNGMITSVGSAADIEIAHRTADSCDRAGRPHGYSRLH